MALKNELANTGNWLFKYRSYLPFIILPFLFYCLSTPLKSNIYYILLYAGLLISFLGQLIRIYTIAYVKEGTSGRNTKKQLAISINKKGIYSTVRHPLYFGNFFIYIGPFIFSGNLYGIFIFILIFWLYYERIMYAEETFLIDKFKTEYLNWASKTPAFIPNPKLFSPTNTNFSLIKILLKEYSGICGIPIIFTILFAYRNYILNITPILTNNWKFLFILNAILYISLRTLKKNKEKTH